MDTNDENKDVVVELKEVVDDSEAMAVPKEENCFEKLECEEVSAQEEEDATANVSPQFLDEKKEDDATQTTAAETTSDQSICMSASKCKDVLSVRINGTLFTGIKSSTVRARNLVKRIATMSFTLLQRRA